MPLSGLTTIKKTAVKISHKPGETRLANSGCMTAALLKA
jgi:hypothetical protein